jgi:hypothetical protein
MALLGPNLSVNGPTIRQNKTVETMPAILALAASALLVPVDA